MKFLTLIRHAKAAHEAGISDADRALAERGRRDGKAMGAILAARFAPPDVILASPARRVRETLAALVEGGGAGGQIEYHDALYLAEHEVLSDFAASALMEHDEVWIVAHNPGITEAIEEIAGARLENVPTLGIARIAVEEVVYESLHGDLVYFETPRSR
jgi:phosphohistidine phosphatase